MFKDFDIKEIVETTLDGNLVKSDLTMLKWRSNNDIQDVDAFFEDPKSPTSLDRIKIRPMEIRTFKIKFLAN